VITEIAALIVQHIQRRGDDVFVDQARALLASTIPLKNYAFWAKRKCPPVTPLSTYPYSIAVDSVKRDEL
jgi:hypothetical protein